MFEKPVKGVLPVASDGEALINLVAQEFRNDKMSALPFVRAGAQLDLPFPEQCKTTPDSCKEPAWMRTPDFEKVPHPVLDQIERFGIYTSGISAFAALGMACSSGIEGTILGRLGRNPYILGGTMALMAAGFAPTVYRHYKDYHNFRFWQ